MAHEGNKSVDVERDTLNDIIAYAESDTLILNYDDYQDDSEAEDPPPAYEEDEAPNPPKVRDNRLLIATTLTFAASIATIFLVFYCTGFFSALSEEQETRKKTSQEQFHPKQPNPYPKPNTWPSKSFALNFPAQYPPLDREHHTGECRPSWESMPAVRCHENIWSRRWDDGITRITDPLPDLATFCQYPCRDDLVKARSNLAISCPGPGENPFDTKGYTGRFNTTLLEADPVQVLDVLIQRHEKMCMTTPIGDADMGYCVADLSLRWNIVDGIKADGLYGLGRFLSATQERKIEPAGQHTASYVSEGRPQSTHYWGEERLFGPGRGETTCSSCTLNWFQEKIGMWEEGKNIQDGGALDLTEWLRSWERGGKRCAGNNFSLIYKAAVENYIRLGLLAADWDLQPSKDIPSMIRNGPTYGDSPFPEIQETIKFLAAYGQKSENVYPTTPERVKHLKDVDGYKFCLEVFYNEARNLECDPFISFENFTTYALSDIPTAQQACSPTSLGSVESLQLKVLEVCPELREWDYFDKELQTIREELPFSFAPYFGRGTTFDNITSACQFGSDISRGPPCGAVFAKWGKADWTLAEPGLKDFLNTTRSLIAALPEIPIDLKEWIEKALTGSLLTEEQARLAEDERKLVSLVKEGVCSDCMVRKFLANAPFYMGFGPPVEIDQEAAGQWIKTLHLLMNECNARGREFQDQKKSMLEVDTLFTQHYGVQALEEALSPDYPTPHWISV